MSPTPSFTPLNTETDQGSATSTNSAPPTSQEIPSIDTQHPANTQGQAPPSESHRAPPVNNNSPGPSASPRVGGVRFAQAPPPCSSSRYPNVYLGRPPTRRLVYHEVTEGHRVNGGDFTVTSETRTMVYGPGVANELNLTQDCVLTGVDTQYDVDSSSAFPDDYVPQAVASDEDSGFDQVQYNAPGANGSGLSARATSYPRPNVQ